MEEHEAARNGRVRDGKRRATGITEWTKRVTPSSQKGEEDGDTVLYEQLKVWVGLTAVVRPHRTTDTTIGQR